MVKLKHEKNNRVIFYFPRRRDAGAGGPTEDTSGNFTLGGWTVPFFDEFGGQVMAEQMSKPFDLLLGRKTFEIFASYWPQHPERRSGDQPGYKIRGFKYAEKP